MTHLGTTERRKSYDVKEKKALFYGASILNS